jgi:hypothetical protein
VRCQGVMIPILMLTSVNQVIGLNIGKDEVMVPVDEFQEKPVDAATLVEKAEELLGRREGTSCESCPWPPLLRTCPCRYGTGSPTR